MGDAMGSKRGPFMRGFSGTLAIAVLSASLGTSSLALAQAKGGAKPAGPAAPAAPAKGGDDKKEAGKHFKKGKELFEKKDYKGAKDEFTKAEEILPAATAEYYIARCAEENGDVADAASWYQKAVDSGKLKDDQASDAKTRLDTLKKKPAKVKITSDPPGATITVDGKAITDKTPAEVELAPGAHKISVSATGKKPMDKDVDVVAFTGATVDVKLDAAVEAADDPFKKPSTTKPETPPETTTTPPATTDTQSGKRDMTWVYVTGGAAVISLGIGTFFGLKALSNKKDFDDKPTRDTRDSGTRNALISDMGFGIGITLAVTSAVLFFTSPAKESAAKAPSMAFAPVIGAPTSKGAPSMAGASAIFNF